MPPARAGHRSHREGTLTGPGSIDPENGANHEQPEPVGPSERLVVLKAPQAGYWRNCRGHPVGCCGLHAADNHPTNAVAESNLVVFYVNHSHETNHLTADKGVYNYSVVEGITNENFTFTGHVTNIITSAKKQEPSWLTSDPLIWDVANNRFEFDNPIMHFRIHHDEGDTNDSLNHL